MSLSNTQFDDIMRGYEERQLQNKRIQEERIAEAYSRNPRLKEIDDAIAANSVSSAHRLLGGDSKALPSLKKKLASYRAERKALLEEMGYSEDYFEPVYTCKDCKDTGYIHGLKCHCLQQAILDVVYTQSNIRSILEKENFSTFSYDFYSAEDKNPLTGLSSRDTAKNAVTECHKFIDDFDNKPKNLLFYGDTGVGKTFLSNCVAKELLGKGYSVIYFTAFQLFDILSKGVFEKKSDAAMVQQNIMKCDLLIIDDLGTELSNAFTSSQLFLCINERILHQKSTIISTNLDMKQLNAAYSERTLSRISSNYTIIKLFGDDIRIQRRRMH